MELSNELKQYMEEHKEGLVLREVPDALLLEMLAKATECTGEIDGKETKGTKAFQQYFNLDMSYTSASLEPEKRGYRKLWVKEEDFYDVNTGDIVAHDFVKKSDIPVEVEHCSAEKLISLLGAKKPQRMYVRAYPETIELLKDVCEKYPHGLKGVMEANILDDGIKAVASKYKWDSQSGPVEF